MKNYIENQEELEKALKAINKLLTLKEKVKLFKCQDKLDYLNNLVDEYYSNMTTEDFFNV